MKDTLHVFGQEWPHDDVYIVGDEESLLRLKESIELLLSKKNKKPTDIVWSTHFPNDGEGYRLYVILKEDMENIIIPYSSDMFEHKSETIIHPSSIVYKKEENK